MRERVIGRAEEGRRVSLTVGDSLLVKLEENPTTGYLWEVESIDARRLSLEESEFKIQSAAVGAGGLRIFRVRATAPGRGHLHLALKRPWAGSGPPDARCAFSFLVEGPRAAEGAGRLSKHSTSREE